MRVSMFSWRRLGIVWALALLLPLHTEANQLRNHPSPYLALHGDDPVDWRPWGKAALDEARREDKLLFVSIGYFSCHWCHVMQRESFSDPAIAKVLNHDYVAVKVDRELDPVLDRRLMNFVQATTGRGGWPLNVFLTPEGYPVAGMTYATPARFLRVIEDLEKRWRDSRDELVAAARDVDTVLSGQQSLDDEALEDAPPPAEWKKPLLEKLMSVADTLKGGFGDQAKFPSVPQLWALLVLGDSDEVESFVRLTFDVMATHGLRDLVGGGFFRYTVNPDWETPHYEKMLYTNALLAMLYLRAAERFGEPRYRTVALDTLDFMAREMSGRDGAFIASLSAVDADGNEGAYYLWSQRQLHEILSPEEMDLVNVGWGMNRYGDDEAEVLPIQLVADESLAEQFDLSPGQLQTKMTRIREKLRQSRERDRTLPRDEKRLAAWNGMALYALADAAVVDRRFLERGKRLRRFLTDSLWRDGRLLKAIDQKGRGMGAASLEDHAWVALGLLQWASRTGDDVAARRGRELVEAAWARFHSDAGWRETEHSLLPRPLLRRHIPDGALPSPEAVLLQATRLLLAAKPDIELKRRYQRVIDTTTQSLEDSLYWYGSLIRVANGGESQVNSARNDTR